MPLGERQRTIEVVGLFVYVSLAVVSGSFVAMAISVLGRATHIASLLRIALAVSGLVALAAREFGWVKFDVPDLGLIVPRHLVSRDPVGAAAVWGTILGAGFLTLVNYAAYWGFQLMLFAMADPRAAMSLGALYGLARSAPALMLWRSNRARAFWQRGSPTIYALAGPMTHAGGVVMLAAAAALLLTAVS